MPKVDVNIRNRLASSDIDKLDVNVGINAVNILADVPSNVFAVDNCKKYDEKGQYGSKRNRLAIWALGYLRCEYAGTVTVEESGSRRVVRYTSQVGFVICRQNTARVTLVRSIGTCDDLSVTLKGNSQ
jgi:hypothetical protein